MEFAIRSMEARDRAAVLEMMRVFYASPAVLSDGSEEIFEADIDACVSGSPYLEGYVFENTEGLLGYAMLAKSFSTEFGRPCLWIEDLYIRDAYQGEGIGSRFLRHAAETHSGYVERLEVEAENEGAIRVYRRNGFDILPYMEMKK